MEGWMDDPPRLFVYLVIIFNVWMMLRGWRMTGWKWRHNWWYDILHSFLTLSPIVSMHAGVYTLATTWVDDMPSLFILLAMVIIHVWMSNVAIYGWKIEGWWMIQCCILALNATTCHKYVWKCVHSTTMVTPKVDRWMDNLLSFSSLSTSMFGW